jgi:hypothetical protein
MKPEDDWIDMEGDLGSPREFSLEKLQPPGRVDKPVLEAVRRLSWRAFDRVCGFFMLIRLWIHNRIYGPEPPTAADLKREADHERLALSRGKRGDPADKMPCRAKSTGEIGSP